MTGNVKNLYACGNTARGSFSFYESVLEGLDRLFILKGGPGTGKSTVIKKIGDEMAERGHDILFIHCPSQNGAVDGLIIENLKTAIVDGTAQGFTEPKSQVEKIYLNLSGAVDTYKLEAYQQEISQLNEQIATLYQQATDSFHDALLVHDEWEKIYISNMDFNKANEVTEEVIDLFFATNTLKKQSKIRHSYFGAATPNGAVDYIQNLTEDIQKRYFVKGRPGSGKSTMLKRLVSAADQRGFDVQVYHCGFDPNSLDMVLLPELSVAIFDSTAPHEYFPDRPTDEILDMYERTITAGTDEQYEQELKEIKGRYSAKMKEATAYLKQVEETHAELIKSYISAVDFSEVEKVKDEIQAQLNKIAQTTR
ncbi:PRK06851 family protein [Brevibacillus dissolubilis]|uniref:PRK06851 family protein n=1 Tax=Brevibacillus dissolubilis TaxID=1844116 RepID=UPI001117344E|nr:PRK06851 family protein [Brevibacillus dissolubilis]